jgi:hypothetical protein
MITKDFTLIAAKILRDKKILRDHGDGVRLALEIAPEG